MSLSFVAYWCIPCLILGAGALQHSHGSLRLQAKLNVSMDFAGFVKEYQRKYLPGTSEYRMRQTIFERHAWAVAEHNEKRVGSTFIAGINHLADWTTEELAGLRGYQKMAQPASNRAGSDALAGLSANKGDMSLGSLQVERNTSAQVLPEEATWSHLESIREPRDQSDCGSCWAFAAETVMRAQSEIHYKRQKFSVSQIVACTPNPQKCGGTGGCGGATSELAYEYALVNSLTDETQLPYLSGRGSCPITLAAKIDSTSLTETTDDGSEVHRIPTSSGQLAAAFRGEKLGMIGWQKFAENKLEPMMRGLVEKGPLAVAIAAGFEWNLYSSGVMRVDEYPQWIVNHAVVLFGYGSDSGVKYWHIKNSWGPRWGEEGNIRLERQTEEEQYCGIDKNPSIGTGCIGGPPEVRVCGSFGILYDTSMPLFRKL